VSACWFDGMPNRQLYHRPSLRGAITTAYHVHTDDVLLHHCPFCSTSTSVVPYCDASYVMYIPLPLA